MLDRRKEKDDWGGDLLRVYLLAERKADGPGQAYEALKQWISRYPTAEYIGLGATSLQLLGRKAEAQTLMRSNRVSDRPLTLPHKEFNERYRAFASAEDPSEEVLLQAAKGLRGYRCRAHYLIGMTHLAGGDRGGAKEHFRQADENRCFNLFIEYVTAAILARLEEDAAWPPWIPVKK